jgi:polyhydroxyalkanoate synthesis repressor PhaR
MSDPARTELDEPAAEGPPVVVKKYANRRLYNTESSSYITLDNLAEMVRSGKNFVVYDAKTSEDITRSVLTQIIVEEESKGRAMLPTGFLRQLISLYGDSMQTIVPRYLEQAMTAFSRQQEQMRLALQQAMGPFFPYGIDEMSRQNRALIEHTISLFSPFYRPPGASAPPAPQAPSGPEAAPQVDSSAEIAALKREIDALRGELARQKAEESAHIAPERPLIRKPPPKP